MRFKSISIAACVFVLPLVPLSELRSQDIDTRTPSDGTLTANNGIVGQSFIAPTGNWVLTDFSFWLRNYFGTPWSYTAQLFEFSGVSPVGTALYTSAVRTTTGSLQQQTFSVGSLALNAGSQYIALIQRANGGAGEMLGLAGASYADGGIWMSLSNPADPTTTSYKSYALGADLMFTANFDEAPVTATPEPATLTLVASGLAGLIGASRRRRKAQT